MKWVLASVIDTLSIRIRNGLTVIRVESMRKSDGLLFHIYKM